MKYYVYLLFFFLCGHQMGAQILEPVKWDWKVENTNKTDEYKLVFHANIEEGWKVYSQYLESDDGPVRTSFNFEGADNVEFLGKNEESGKIKSGYDKMFDMNVISINAPKATFTQRVKVKEYGSKVTGYLEFMTCNDQQCLPPTAIDFSFDIPRPEKKTDSGKSQGKVELKNNDSSERIVKKALKKEEVLTTKKTKEYQLSSEISEGTKTVSTEKKDLESTASEPVGFQSDAPVSWSLRSTKIDDNTLSLDFKASVQDNWTIYSQFTSDDGPVPTSIELEGEQAHSLLSKAEEKGKLKEGMDPFFGVEVKKFVSSPVHFIQKVSINGDAPVTGYLTYMTCDDKQCLPPTPVDFWVNPNTLETYLGPQATARMTGTEIAESNTFTVNESEELGAMTGRKIEGNIIDQLIPNLFETQKKPSSDCGVEETTRNSNLLWTFIGGFLGGLVALLTPCVFPMIPLTVSYFTKGSKDRKSGIRNGLIYGLSIIAIYVGIGLVITGFFGATALNELSTNWVANVLFFIIFVVFAISFFGYFEITLPSSWSSASDRMADKGGLIGTFFMAFTLALVSFSCTGPIIGSALVQSATESLGPFTVMLGFSTALALPFGLFAAFPALLNSLPQSGGWMNSVKVVLGFLELALALKFLSVADMTMHWGILKYELFMGLWVLIFAAMALYAFGLIKFPHDSPIKKLSMGRWILGIAATLVTVYLASGFLINKKTGVYDSLPLMSGLAPPATYNYFLKEKEPDEEIKARYASYTTCANNINCFKDYFEGLAYAQEVDKPLFLDFTGYGCVNCRKTEEHIWVDDRVKNRLNEDFVLVSLYVDDRDKLENAFLSKHTQKKMRSIGNMWADFQIVNFEQNSQPLYVMVDTDQTVIASPRGYHEGIKGYLEFLDCGLSYLESREK